MNRKQAQPLLLAGALALSASFAWALGAKPRGMDEEEVIARIQPVAKLQMTEVKKADPGGTGRPPEEIYKAICSACHDNGVANAPKLGDKAAWAPRVKAGFDAMIANATKGKNAMPPNGGSDASAEELARVIAFMANKAGANFKAP